MTGTWSAFDPKKPAAGKNRDRSVDTYVFAFTMRGRWLFGADGKTTDYFYVTYDPFTERWLLVRLQANPAYGVFVSEKGWEDDRIAFTSSFSSVNGRPSRHRVTIVRVDARHAVISDEEELDGGAWVLRGTLDFVKQ